MTSVEYGDGLNDCVQQENGHGTHQKKKEKKTVMASQLRNRRSRPKMSLEVLFC